MDGCILSFPFLGEWYVSQGHNGKDTHIGEWAEAWDFVILNKESSQFSGSGDFLQDYYCFGQNVIAPADGTVVIAEDGIEDNKVGVVNTFKNWGKYSYY